MPLNVNALPRSITLSVAGLAGTIVLVTGAAVLQPPLDDDAGTSAAAPDRSTERPVRPRASAAPSATAAPEGEGAGASSAAPQPDAPTSPREARARFNREVQSRRLKEAVATLEKLLELDPAAPKDAEVRDDIVELAMRVMLLEGPEPDKVFELISAHMDTTGADILYELITTRGGSRAARQAEETLKDASVRARGTPALRVAYELRGAKSCNEKIALLDRAGADGDGRALGQLQLVNRECGRRSADCCLRNNPKLKAALAAIKERMGG